jgi:addiction module RelE/StbE family toxin
MRIVGDKVFDRQYKKLSKSLQDKIWERLALLIEDASNPLLQDHKLNPPFDGYRSINITGDYRLVYKKLDADTYYLRAIGTHHKLYGS